MHISPSFRPWQFERLDRAGQVRGGGLALIINPSICYTKFDLLPYPNGKMEILTIKINYENGWNVIAICYASDTITQDEFSFYLAQLPENTLISGDFNAHHRHWEPTLPLSGQNTTGKNLFNSVMSTTFSLITPSGLITRVDPYTNRESTLDLSFGNGIFYLPDAVELGPNLGGDHAPVLHMFSNMPTLTIRQFKPRWKITTDGCNKFRALASTAQVPPADTLNDNVKNLTTKFVEMAHECFVLSKGRMGYKAGKPWWSEECSEAVALRRRLYRYWRKHPERANRLAYRCQDAITVKTLFREKRKQWRKFCGSLSFDSPITKVWRFFGAMLGRPYSQNLPLEVSGALLASNFEKAQKLADYFSEALNNHLKLTLSTEQSHYLQACLESDSGPHDFAKRFSLHELQMTISNLPKDKAMGEDMIPYDILKCLSAPMEKSVLGIFNENWRKGVFPTTWKLAAIIPIHKAGKPVKDASSYRPISLLSCLGKLMERMVCQRLMWYLESSSLLPDSQCGFRKSRCTTDILVQLEHHIQISLKTRQISLIVFLDLKSAFDNATHCGIVLKLAQRGIKGAPLKFFKDYLNNRKYSVVVGNTSSDSFNSTSGVPQGAVLSPTLFAILLSDFPHTEDTLSFMYADDIAVIANGTDYHKVQQKLQRAVSTIMEWFDEWGLVANPNKSKVLCFTRKRLPHFPVILAKGQLIPYTTKHKYLGLTFDGPLLTWKYHIDDIILKCQSRLDVMRRSCGKKWGASRDTMLLYYQTYIRSLLDYGGIVYGSAAPTQLKKLDVIQNAAIRLALGAYKTTPIVSLNTEAHILPLKIWRNIQSGAALIRIQQLPLDHPTFQLLSDTATQMGALNWPSATHMPFFERAMAYLQEIGLPQSDFTPIPAHYLSPLARYVTIHRPNTCLYMFKERCTCCPQANIHGLSA